MVNTADISQAVITRSHLTSRLLDLFLRLQNVFVMTTGGRVGGWMEGRFFSKQNNFHRSNEVVFIRLNSPFPRIERPIRGRSGRPHATADDYFLPIVSWDFSFSK